MAGVYKEITDDNFAGDNRRKRMNECEKQLGGLLAIDFPSAIVQQKEKKFFSFLKWFKKNKDASNWKNANASSSSATSSPVLKRKESSSYESLDTIFSTQTVRSFAYIPPLRYQPSAPTSSMLDIDQGETVSGPAPLTGGRTETKEVELVCDKKKKKRKAPNPPSCPKYCFTRENSLPSSLERKCGETFHRRTVSESSKDKKAGAYCHVQGKRKAPLPPSKTSLYPDAQKLNFSHQSLHKKKKPAPTPPPPMAGAESFDSKSENRNMTSSKLLASERVETSSSPSQMESKSAVKNISNNASPTLSSRPWYKRNNCNKDTGPKDFIKRDLLKGFEKVKKKDMQDWMPEVGYSRGRSLASPESVPGKFIMFAKADKSDDKKKEEKRKSQISILTNISELDKEAAEIVRKEKIEGKKMQAANDAKYYSNSKSEEDPRGFGQNEKNEWNAASQSVGVGSRSKSRNVASRCSPVSCHTGRAGGARFASTQADHAATKSASATTVTLARKSGDVRAEVSPMNPTDTDFNAGDFEEQKKGPTLRYFSEPWVCTKCTLENPGWKMFCEVCSSVKSRFLYNIKERPTERKIESYLHHGETRQEGEKWTGANAEHGSEEAREKRADVHFSERDAARTRKSDDNMVAPTGGANAEKTKNDSKKMNISLKVVENVGVGALEMKCNSVHIGSQKKCEVEEKEPAADPSTSNIDKSKVVEAYVVTHSTVLEDVVVAKTGVGKTGFGGKCKPAEARRKNEAAPVDERLKEVTSKEPLDLVWRPGTNELELDDNVQELTRIFSRVEELEDLRATIGTTSSDTAVDDVLEKLEAAIRGGDKETAAELARALARLKIKCSSPKEAERLTESESEKITIDIYVEDKLSHRGPIRALVSPCMTLLQLKNKIQQELDIPVHAQRWILDKCLANDGRRTLESYGVKNDSCSVFLYLVSPGKDESATSNEERGEWNAVKEETGNTHESTAVGQTSKSPQSRNDHKASVKTVEQEQTRARNSGNLLKFKTPEDDAVNTSKGMGSDVSIHSVKQKVDPLNRAFEDDRKKGVSSSPDWECRTRTCAESDGRALRLECSSGKLTHVGKYECKVNGVAAKAPRTSRRSEVPAEATASANIHYDELIRLQDADIVVSTEPFHCRVCLTDHTPEDGITLKDCLHTFCRQCLVNTVQYSENAEVKCPYMDETYSCKSVLQQREIKALVSQQVFDQHLAKSVKEAENKIENAFHCKTPDCKGWCVFEDNVNEFHCPVCAKDNCLTCHAIHMGINCKQYQEELKDASDLDADAKKTKIMLQEMVLKGEAMACPKCQVILMKKWGCDWLRCSMCKTEICWVTRGFRWGPAGKGDTSAGCKCGFNGVKCHPKCNYCH